MFGGRSLEHDVSVVSGLQILHAIDPERFAPMPIYIDQATRWWVGDDLWHTDTFKGGGPDRSRLIEVALSPGFGTSRAGAGGYGCAAVRSRPGRRIGRRNAGGGAIPVDVFVPVLHGTYGEDGCVQGALELGGCAYVGCGVMASAVGMNKRATKIMAAHAGVPIVQWLACERSVLDRGHGMADRAIRARRRVASAGRSSSSRATSGRAPACRSRPTADELIAGILKVFEYDVEAMIEPFIRNRLEINVAVAGLDEPVASVTEMPVTSQASPLTFAEKYRQAGAQEHRVERGHGRCAARARSAGSAGGDACPRATLRHDGVSALGCEGISRIDFLIDADTNELFFNEINTLPGSLAFYLWSAAPHHWTITELLARLIDRAERLRAMKRGLQRKPPAELKLLA